MAVVLCQSADAREARELSGFFPPIDRSGGSVADGQFSIRARLGFIEHHKVGAVHGLEIIIRLALETHQWIHRVVFAQMPRDFIKLSFRDMRYPNRFIAVLFLKLLDKIFNRSS